MNEFLESAKNGKNKWWRYVFTILSIVIVIVLLNLTLQKIFDFKKLFSENYFYKELITFVLIGGIFGLALITFVFAFDHFHKRPFFSLINVCNRWNWALYVKGFAIWGTLIFIGALITDYSSFEKFLNKFNFFILFCYY